MKIRWTEHRKYDVIEALGAEILLGGKPHRNAVAFWTPPTSSDLEAASLELKKWAKREREKWAKERDEWLEKF